MSDNTPQTPSNLSDKASEYYFSAPVEMPTREQMKVKLVPLHLINRLEEARSDGQFWGSVFWTALGAIFGIVCNWVTSDPLKITRPSLVVMVVLGVICFLTFVGGIRKYRRRVDNIKSEFTQAGVNLPDRELATLQRQTAGEVLTMVSGEVGGFSNKRNGPWTPPVACKPVHSRWRIIEGATWVWIKEQPTDQEAQSGQVVWHRFSFRLDRPSTWVSEAKLSLMADDYAKVFINGKSVRKVSINEEVVEMDVSSYLRSGDNVVEIELENLAYPQSTGLSNPTGIIYRLDVR